MGERECLTNKSRRTSRTPLCILLLLTHIPRFVDRYIPGYVLFSDGVTKGSLTRDDWKAPSWKGKGLRITVDENRDFIASDRF
jgi:hypothetical protein